MFRLRRYDHITDALAILHWLHVPQRIDYKIAVMAFRVLHGLALPYLDQLFRVADLPGRHTRSLHSSTSHQLDIHRPSVVSGRRINSAIWDSVVTFADSVSSTTEDVSISGIIVLLWWLCLHGPRNNICYSGHANIFWLIDTDELWHWWTKHTFVRRRLKSTIERCCIIVTFLYVTIFAPSSF